MKSTKALSKFVLLLIVAMAIEQFSPVRANKEPSNAKEEDLLIYPTGREIKHFSLQSGNIRGVTYKITARYPASEVILFYDKEIAKLGFEPFVEPYYKYSDRTWQTFEDQTQRGDTCIAQFLADWISPEQRKRARLMMRYVRRNKCNAASRMQTDDENLQVTFQVMPHLLLPPLE